MDIKEIKKIQKQAAILFFEYFIDNKSETNKRQFTRNKIYNFKKLYTP